MKKMKKLRRKKTTREQVAEATESAAESSLDDAAQIQEPARSALLLAAGMYYVSAVPECN